MARDQGAGGGVRIVAIAVVAANGVIGDGFDQPFKFREDWARFKHTTMGHPLVAGRKTYDAMGLLPGRALIVVTRDPASVRAPDCVPEGAELLVAQSIDEALSLAQDRDDVCYVVGGGQIYRQAWDRLTKLDLTEVHRDAVGAVTFPDVDPDVWRETSREPRGDFDFVTYTRR